MRRTKVDVPTRDGVADAYLVTPDGDGPFPWVLLYPDAFGLRPRLAEMADRIAERGYAVLAPNLLYRGGRCPQLDMAELADPERRDAAFGKVMPHVHGLTRELIERDAESYLDALDPEAKVVVVGYCMGGMNAIRTAEAFPDRVAGVGSFHAGRLVTDKPDSPHLRVGGITGELYVAHADNDQSMTPDHIRTLEAALDAAGVRYTSEVYPGAGHGFTMADTAAYHEEGERRHWTNLFALLERALPVKV